MAVRTKLSAEACFDFAFHALRAQSAYHVWKIESNSVNENEFLNRCAALIQALGQLLEPGQKLVIANGPRPNQTHYAFNEDGILIHGENWRGHLSTNDFSNVFLDLSLCEQLLKDLDQIILLLARRERREAT